jgi:hypothetical protein
MKTKLLQVFGTTLSATFATSCTTDNEMKTIITFVADANNFTGTINDGEVTLTHQDIQTYR